MASIQGAQFDQYLSCEWNDNTNSVYGDTPIFTKWDTAAGADDKIIPAVAATDNVLGITHTPKGTEYVQGDANMVDVGIFGFGLLTVTGDIKQGDKLAPTANGRGAKVTTGKWFCEAMESIDASTDEKVISVWCNGGGKI